MKVSQFRRILEQFAALHDKSGRMEDAQALRHLARALQSADDKSVIRTVHEALEASGRT